MIKVSTYGKIINKLDFGSVDERADEVISQIDNRTGEGNDFLGWLDYASKLPEEEIARIEEAAKKIRKNFAKKSIFDWRNRYFLRKKVDFNEKM